VGFEDIINLCPLRALCQKVFPASSNFSPEVKKLLTNLIQSLQSEPSSCEGANGRNPEQGRGSKASFVAWQVLKVALLFPILGRVLPRDLSPLKPVLVEGAWDRVRKGLAPLEAGGAFR
jgi:hypothetical protein